MIESFIFAMALGLVPAGIATSKGRPFMTWWVYGAGLFIIAFPHSLMLAPGEGHGGKRCPFCAELIKEAAVVCRYCGRGVPDCRFASREAAQREAERRWGSGADVDEEDGIFFVGREFSESETEVMGQGRTWDEAFANADAKAGDFEAGIK